MFLKFLKRDLQFIYVAGTLASITEGLQVPPEFLVEFPKMSGRSLPSPDEFSELPMCPRSVRR